MFERICTAWSTRQEGTFMQSRKYYEAYWSQYDDVVTLNEFRKMLGGLGEVQARRLLQNKTVKSFKIRGEYHIPKQCVIDYVLSTHYAKYRQILKAQILKWMDNNDPDSDADSSDQ